jgi:glycosyltransferase involved in cell wall biosynthesis
LLAAAISRIISDHLLVAGLVEAGRREVEAWYTWDRVLPMYRQLLGIA